MADYGFTSSGFTRPTMAEIRQNIIDTLESNWKRSIKTTPDSILGQMIDCLAEREATLWETLEAGINNINPLEADDSMLDKAVSFVGVTRIPASKGTATITVEYNAVSSYTIPAKAFIVSASDGSSAWENPVEVKIGKTKVSKAKLRPKDALLKAGAKITSLTFNKISYKWSYTQVPENATANSIWNDFISVNGENLTAAGLSYIIDGDYLIVDFKSSNGGSIIAQDSMFTTKLYTKIDVQCQSTGSISALKGTLTKLSSTLQEGLIESVINEEDAVTGHARESASELRVRYEQGAQYINGGCTDKAIEENIKQYCQNIENVKVFSNKEDVTDSMGRPPHSTHVVVKGGVASQIGNLVFNLLPGGMPTFGNTVVEIDKDNSIKIDRPTPVYIHMRIHVEGDPTKDEDMTKGVVVSIPTTIAQYGENTHTIGTNVVSGRILSNVYNLQGVILATMKMARTTSETVPSDDEFKEVPYIDIADNEYAVFNSSNIIVQ